jgi:hypothetical protein
LPSDRSGASVQRTLIGAAADCTACRAAPLAVGPQRCTAVRSQTTRRHCRTVALWRVGAVPQGRRRSDHPCFRTCGRHRQPESGTAGVQVDHGARVVAQAAVRYTLRRRRDDADGLHACAATAVHQSRRQDAEGVCKSRRPHLARAALCVVVFGLVCLGSCA